LVLLKPEAAWDRLDREHRVMNPALGRLALVVGHTRARPGAYGIGLIGQHEYEFNGRLADLILRRAREREVAARVFYRDESGVEGAYAAAEAWGCDAVVELHFNATRLYWDVVQGTEMLGAGRDAAGSMALARSLQRTCLSALERPPDLDRGVKRCSLRVCTSLPTAITEPVFGNNWDEAKLLQDRREAYATSVVDGYVAFVLDPAGRNPDPDAETAVEHLPPDLAS
jgi:N-acetylmuramoyl-L-alanine amidase